MYYKLNSKYLLRGWQQLPYALVDKETKAIMFVSGKYGCLIEMCTGMLDMDSLLFSAEQRKVIGYFADQGYLAKSEFPCEIEEEQKYFQYPCRFIKSAHWSITGLCNYRCKHCYMSAPHAKYGMLSHEDCMRIVDQLAECGIFKVSLTGGEPLLREDFMDIVDALLQHDIQITTIFSNGKLINREFLQKLRDRGISPEINISFDGVGWHDWLRGVDGAEEIAKNAFRLCHEMGFRTDAEMCLHRKNKDVIRESVQLLKELHVEGLKISPVMDVGEWTNVEKDLALTEEEIYETYLSYIPQYMEDGQPISIMLGNLFMADGSGKYRIPGIHRISDPEKYCICGHARNHLYIAADGRLLPCMPLSGNDEIASQFPMITKMELKDALSDSVYMSCIDTKLSEYLHKNDECRNCKYQLECGGGCRGQALNYDKTNYLGIDKAACLLFKNDYIERLKQIMDKWPMKEISQFGEA